MSVTTPEERHEAARQKIAELLDNYVDGQNIFKNAKDWDHPVQLKPEACGRNDLPTGGLAWLELVEKAFAILAEVKYGLNTYPNVIEIITSDQMLDAYSSVGMPVSYHHWSFGKQREIEDKKFKEGRMGLAYEIVINTDPTIAYCMETNSPMMQMLVISHASFGHNTFFKNNHLFTDHTKARNIVSDMIHLKECVRDAEERYGIAAVEELLDACHALQSYAVNRYNKPKTLTLEEAEARRARLEQSRIEAVDVVMDRTLRGTGAKNEFEQKVDETPTPDKGDDNILRYVGRYAPHLKPWQREIIGLFCDQAQYFYPQMQTQLMNEGCASFWHYTMMNDFADMGLIDDGMMLEFMQSHAGVLFQPDHDDPRFSQINPYALGFAMMKDIQRICTDPTDEDRKWFPEIAGNGDWLNTLKEAWVDFRDESFVSQYLSPEMMRKFHLFGFTDDDEDDMLEVNAIHNERGYREVREMLAAQYRLSDRQPHLEIAEYDFKGNRALTIHHLIHDRKPLHEGNTTEVMKHLYRLWGHPVLIHSMENGGKEPVSTLAVGWKTLSRDQKAKLTLSKL